MLNSAEVIHLLPTNNGNQGLANGEDGAKSTPNKSTDHSISQAATVFSAKGGGSTGSEVRRPVGICMSVMSTVFCRKVFALILKFLLSLLAYEWSSNCIVVTAAALLIYTPFTCRLTAVKCTCVVTFTLRLTCQRQLQSSNSLCKVNSYGPVLMAPCVAFGSRKLLFVYANFVCISSNTFLIFFFTLLCIVELQISLWRTSL